MEDSQDYYDIGEGNQGFQASFQFFNLYKQSLEKISEEPLSQQSSQKQEAFGSSLSLLKKTSLLSRENGLAGERVLQKDEFGPATPPGSEPPCKMTYALSRDFFAEPDLPFKHSSDLAGTPDFPLPRKLLLKSTLIIGNQHSNEKDNNFLDFDTFQQKLVKSG